MLLSAQVFSCEFCEISKNTFSYKTPVAASAYNLFLMDSRKPQGNLCEKMRPQVFSLDLFQDAEFIKNQDKGYSEYSFSRMSARIFSYW